MLLTADGDRLDVVEATGSRGGLLEGVPPRVRVHLGAVGMGGRAAADELTALRVTDDDLAGLGGGVDPCDECHEPRLVERSGSVCDGRF